MSLDDDDSEYMRNYRRKCEKERMEYEKRMKEPPRKYLEDEMGFTNLELLAMVFLTMMMGLVIYQYDYMHVLALKFYANVGDKDAQHILAQRYYLGQGVERNKSTAFYWFKEAAKQGHGQASYNLGVAHIQGFHRLDRKGHAHELLKHAASVGVKEAEHVLQTACAKGECDR